MLSSAETWRRLPLTSTSVWSGLSPRSVAGRSTSVPSAIDGCGKLNDGTSWLRILLVSVSPVLVSASPPMTSIGTGESATVRSVRRVPVTMIVLSGSGCVCGGDRLARRRRGLLRRGGRREGDRRQAGEQGRSSEMRHDMSPLCRDASAHRRAVRGPATTDAANCAGLQRDSLHASARRRRRVLRIGNSRSAPASAVDRIAPTP